MALSMTVIPSVLWAQKPATEHTIRANETVKTELNVNVRILKTPTEDLLQALMEKPYWAKTEKCLIQWRNGIF